VASPAWVAHAVGRARPRRVASAGEQDSARALARHTRVGGRAPAWLSSDVEPGSHAGRVDPPGRWARSVLVQGGRLHRARRAGGARQGQSGWPAEPAECPKFLEGEAQHRPVDQDRPVPVARAAAERARGTAGNERQGRRRRGQTGNHGRKLAELLACEQHRLRGKVELDRAFCQSITCRARSLSAASRRHCPSALVMVVSVATHAGN
jgi:hypothetical protein